MGPISTGLGEIYQFEVRGEPMCPPGEPDTDACYTPMELRTVLDWYVNYQLRSVPGIVEVNSFGGELKTYQVTIDPEPARRLRAHDGRRLEALEHNNRNVGGGYIAHQGEQYLIRGEGLSRRWRTSSIVLAADREGTPVTSTTSARSSSRR
jgi:cobalt-zinc-cadmium resistance protein CzcA